LSECDVSLRPSPACCSTGRPRDDEIGDGGDIVEDGIPIVGPSIHAKAERHDASPKKASGHRYHQQAPGAQQAWHHLANIAHLFRKDNGKAAAAINAALAGPRKAW
jgi:hypothetical protein